MFKKLHKTVAVVTVIAALTTSCRSNEEYKKLAKAADDYTEATDQLLEEAGDIQIQTTSEVVLRNYLGVTGYYTKKENEVEYRQLSQKDKKILDLFTEVRNHNRLLQSYFYKLQELATSDAPERVEADIENTLSGLQMSRAKILDLSPSPINIPGLFAQIGQIEVSNKINNTIKKELERNSKVIFQELQLQQELLKKIKDIVESNIKYKQELQETRLIVTPLKNQQLLLADDLTNWIKTRQDIFNSDINTIVGINSSISLLEDFSNSFRNAINLKISNEEINKVTQDTNSFINFVSTNK